MGFRNVQNNVCQLSVCDKVHDNCCCCHCDDYHVPMAKTKDTKIRLPGTKVHSGQVTLHPYISTRLHSVGLDGQDHMLMILLKCISKEISLTIYIRIFFRCCYCTICCNIYLLENIEHELFFQFVL